MVTQICAVYGIYAKNQHLLIWIEWNELLLPDVIQFEAYAVAMFFAIILYKSIVMEVPKII